jgi:hypothetical protein
MKCLDDGLRHFVELFGAGHGLTSPYIRITVVYVKGSKRGSNLLTVMAYFLFHGLVRGPRGCP